MVDSTPEEHILEYQNQKVDSKIPIDPPREATVTRKRLAWI
jgi:hypothetical protein